MPPAHGPRPAGCLGQQATIVSLPEPGAIQALFWAWRKRKRKQRKELLSWAGGGDWVGHLLLLPERAPRPTGWEGSHIGSKDPRDLKEAGRGAGVLRTQGEGAQTLSTHWVLTRYSKRPGHGPTFSSVAPEPLTHLQPQET